MSPAREERLRFILIFTALFGIVLFLTRPDPTRAQTLFRARVVAVGIAGLTWLHIRNSSNRS